MKRNSFVGNKMAKELKKVKAAPTKTTDAAKKMFEMNMFMATNKTAKGTKTPVSNRVPKRKLR